jgi:hypothetical protein
VGPRGTVSGSCPDPSVGFANPAVESTRQPATGPGPTTIDRPYGKGFQPTPGHPGRDQRFRANALRALRGHGLQGTGASGYVPIDHGGTGWATVQAANARQVRDGLIGQGISPRDIDRFLEVMADPDTIAVPAC